MFYNFIFLLDNFVMTTEQRTNLKFRVRLGKSLSEALCMLPQVYEAQILSRSTVFPCHKKFKERSEDVEDDPRCGNIMAQTTGIPRYSVMICQILFRFNPSSFEISRTVNRRSPRTIFFTSSTLVWFLLVEGLPHLGSSSKSSRPFLNLLCQRKTVKRDKVCFFQTYWSIQRASEGDFTNGKQFEVGLLLCCHYEIV